MDTERGWAQGTGSALLPREHASIDLTELVPAPRQELGSVVSARDDHLDVRLHAPSPQTVIVWVAGPLHLPNSGLLAIRVRQQLHRAPHVILDLTSVTGIDLRVAGELYGLLGEAESCRTRLHIAAETELVVEGLRRIGLGRHVVLGSADAVLASLASR